MKRVFPFGMLALAEATLILFLVVFWPSAEAHDDEDCVCECPPPPPCPDLTHEAESTAPQQEAIEVALELIGAAEAIGEEHEAEEAASEAEAAK